MYSKIKKQTTKNLSDSVSLGELSKLLTRGQGGRREKVNQGEALLELVRERKLKVSPFNVRLNLTSQIQIESENVQIFTELFRLQISLSSVPSFTSDSKSGISLVSQEDHAGVVACLLQVVLKPWTFNQYIYLPARQLVKQFPDQGSNLVPFIESADSNCLTAGNSLDSLLFF